MTQNIYFTADLHFGHKNILTLAHRRFKSIEEHDNFVVENINKTVLPSDYLYILGDLGFHKDFMGLLSQLSKINCKNIHIIKGNHDNMANLIHLKKDNIIADVKEMKTVQKGRRSIFCCHYPMREWPGFYRGHYHAYGHVHGTISPFERSMDVGIDSIGYKPIEFDDLIQRIDENYKEFEGKITKEDEMINKFFPDLNIHYFVGLCTGNEKIRNTIYKVLKEGK